MSLSRIVSVFSVAVWCMGCALPQPSLDGLPEDARYSYAVVPELRADFLEAAGRIFDASGIFLHEHPEGTPIGRVHEVKENACGDTLVSGWPDRNLVKSVTITIYDWQPGCFEDLSNTVLHELIHSLRRLHGLESLSSVQVAGADEAAGHADSGIFTATRTSDRLDESSLTMICEAAPCTAFNPEE